MTLLQGGKIATWWKNLSVVVQSLRDSKKVARFN